VQMKSETQDLLKRNLSLLKEVAKQLGTKTQPLNLTDLQVSRTPFDWKEALKSNAVVPSDRFIRQLRYGEDENRVLIRVNDEYVVIEIHGSFGGNIICSFNEKNVFDKGSPLGTVILAPAELCSLYGLPIYMRSDEVSRDAPSMLQEPAIRKGIKSLSLEEEESLHILSGQAFLYLKRYERDRILDALNLLTTLAKSLPTAPEEALDFTALPNEFHSLIPLIKKWGITDDEERNEKLGEASRAARVQLIKAVAPHFKAINRFLDSCGDSPLSEAAVLLGALAECASEAMVGTKG
jgi:hypothetical protein